MSNGLATLIFFIIPPGIVYWLFLTVHIRRKLIFTTLNKSRKSWVGCKVTQTTHKYITNNVGGKTIQNYKESSGESM